jgi:hypothetical protein
MSVNVVLKSVWDDKGIQNAQKSLSSLGGSLGKFGGILAGAFSVAAITNFASSAIKAAESAEVANNRLDQIASSMGIFGSQTTAVTDRLKDFADQQMMIIGQDDELIKSTQAKLLTFKELAATADDAGGAFDRATIAAFDLAAAGFGSAETNAVQLGKALQDPIKGIAALARSGVTFTKSQKDQIATLVESNRMLEAQDLILTAIEQQVGGTAAATVTSTQKIALIFGELSEAAGMALLPAVEAVATQLETHLVPMIERFGSYLQSPEGTQAVNGFATAISEVTQFLISSASWLGENWNWVSKVGAAILVTVTALTAFKTALELAKVAQLLFNIAANANPYILLATAIIAALGLIASGISQITAAQDEQNTATSNSTGELNRFNNIKLDGIKGQINGVASAATTAATAISNMNQVSGPGLDPSGRSLLEAPRKQDFPLNPKPGQVFTWFKWENVNGQTLAVWYEQTWDGTKWSSAKKVTNTNSGTPPKDTETTADRFKKVQAVIKKAQAAIAAAEQNYANTVFEINKASNDRIFELNRAATERQEGLVLESKARITDAFKSATQISLGDLFSSSTTRQLETQVRQLSERLTVTVTKETEKTAYTSVTEMISGLRDRLNASKNLLANASKLAGLGFKQTFIEQVLETGTESGNALAGAILESSPETQAELKKLFADMEDVSETGADTLANQIYDKFGLATRAMKNESVIIQRELNLALVEEQKILTKNLADAAIAFQTEIQGIKTQFLADLEQFDGKFAGLGNTIKGVIGNLNTLIRTASGDIQEVITDPNSGTALAGATVTENVTLADLQNTTGIVIDSVTDVAGAIAYLQARIKAANAYIKLASSNAEQDAAAGSLVANWTKDIANLKSMASTGNVAGTVVNINVRTDSAQSQAMVGKTIGKIVTKYVTTGGQVLVSGS